MKTVPSNDLTPYFFTLKEVTSYLRTSPSTYTRREGEGKAPKGQKLFGHVKLYSRADIILFAQGNWKAAEGK